MKHDPTKTKSIIQSYESTLVKRFRVFKSEVLAFFKRNASRFQKDMLVDQLIELSVVEDVNAYLDDVEGEYIFNGLKKIIQRYVHTAYSKAVIHASKNISRVYGFDVSFQLTPADLIAVELIADHHLAEIKGLTAFMKKEILRMLSVGVLEGHSIDKISANIRERVDVSISRARMIARTETIRCYNEAAKDRYSKNDISQWVWIAAFDERTCEECMSYDGKLFDMHDEPPPAHPNCRCSIAPYVDDELTPLDAY